MANVLIAGCGYVGTALGQTLARDGHTVWGLRRQPEMLPKPIRPVAASLGEPDTLRELPRNVEYVVYTASPTARTDQGYADAYVHGVQNLLDALAAQRALVRRVAMTTSTAVYGQTDGRWVEETSPTEPQHFSGQRLLEGERTLRAGPFPSTVVRLSGIYGPGRTGMLRRVWEGTARCPRTPRYSNRIHRDDCAGVLRHVLGLSDPDGVYVATDYEPAELCDVMRWVADRLGVAPPPYQNGDEAAAAASPRGRTNKRCRNDRLIATGYRFVYPTFRAGYPELIDAFLRETRTEA